MEITGHILSVFMGFFAIMNPIANTPVFLGLTADDSPAIRRQVAAKALLTTFALIVVFCLMGKLIFSLFGITLPAFRVTGGVLVALIGYQMLHGEQSSVHQPTSADKQNSLDAALSIAVTPLAIPILGGPGTIATAMNYASDGGLFEMVTTIIAFAVLC
ncbi:MAG TPA: MarC family protein, partial [Gammaproteobacteria bacterium]|nr:MarC family protein [Gammaproteobacteria bacterium]